MSLVALGLAGELRGKIAVNALWPRATIATAAIKNLLGGDRVMRMSRTPEIMADAAYAIFLKPATSFTGHFLIDDSSLPVKASPISRNTAPCRANRWPAPSSSPTAIRRRRPASASAENGGSRIRP